MSAHGRGHTRVGCPTRSRRTRLGIRESGARFWGHPTRDPSRVRQSGGELPSRVVCSRVGKIQKGPILPGLGAKKILQSLSSSFFFHCQPLLIVLFSFPHAFYRSPNCNSISLLHLTSPLSHISPLFTFILPLSLSHRTFPLLPSTPFIQPMNCDQIVSRYSNVSRLPPLQLTTYAYNPNASH